MPRAFFIIAVTVRIATGKSFGPMAINATAIISPISAQENPNMSLAC